MNETRQGPPPPPKRLESNLRSYRSRMRLTKLTEHFAVALCALVVSFLIVAALDRFFDTSGAVRAVLFGASLAVSAFIVPRALNRWFLRHGNLREVAREVTLRDAAVGDRFLGVYELSRDAEEFERSPELVAAAIAQGERDLGDFDLKPLLPPSRHKRALGLLAIPAAAAAVFAATLPAVAGNALKRWALPFGDTERYTFARLDGLAEAWVMPIQEAGSQSLALATDTERTPSEAVLHLRGGAISAPLVDGRYALELPPLAEDQNALLVVGDVRETIRLEPRERPEIVAASAAVVLPKYLGIDEPLDRDVRGGSLVVVEGAKLSVSLAASRGLASASATATDTAEDGTLSEAATGIDVQVTGPTMTLPAESPMNGRNLLVSWVDELGLEGHRPFKLGVRTRPDETPVVALSGADAETVLLETVPLTFDVLTSDDFGVRRIGLEWRKVGRFGRPSDEILGEKVLLAGGPADDTLEAFATFQPTTLGVEAGTYEIRGWAEDSMPGRARALSTPIRVRVMTPSQHMNWVTANLDRWMQRAVEVRDREMELLAENKAIHALPQGELDMPETRSRIENQARAERGNRARLQGLVSQGQELLAEAARNDEFGSNALDDWAEANAKLKDIADTRMDSVAKRLQEAARAETQAKASGEPKQADGSPKNPATQAGPPKPPGASGQQPKDSGGEESDAKMAAAEPPPGGADPKSKKKDPKIIGRDLGEAGGSSTKPKEGEEEEDNPEDEIPPTPTIQDGESTKGKAEPGAPKEAPKGPPPKASLGLVETTLGPAPDDGSEPPKDSADSPAEEQPSKTREEIAAAIAEQEALLEAFNEVAGDIEDVLVALENSTFVKRLKAASRAQDKSSEDLDVSVASGFGSSVAIESEEIKKATKAVSERRDDQLPKLTHLHSDMDAYFDRLTSRSSEDAPKFERVLNEWNQLRPTLLADAMVEEAGGGRPGDARASADFLSDTFDRWGEELVGPG